MRPKPAAAPVVTTLALVLALLVVRPAAACSCIGDFRSDQPCESYWGSTVFAGRAVAVEEFPAGPEQQAWESHKVFRFDVLEGFAGVDGPTIEIRTGMGGGDCGFEFRLGQSYFVYAWHGEHDTVLRTSLCSATTALGNAADHLAYARQVATGAERVGVYGLVHRRERESFDDYPGGDEVSGARVTVTGPGDQRFTAVTDASGRFEVRGRLAGPYTVAVELPPGLPTIPEQQVVVEPGQCYGVELKVTTLGSVEGRVVDAEGAGLERLGLQLLPVDGRGQVAGTELDGSTGAEGYYVFEDIPPGIYVLAFVSGGMPDFNDPPFPSTYFPGADEPVRASRFRLAASERLELADFTLGPRQPLRTIEGKVSWPDGRPAAGASVVCRLASADNGGLRETTDAAGRFSLPVYEGNRYGVQATGPEGAPPAHAERREVLVGADGEVIDLVLDRPGEVPEEDEP